MITLTIGNSICQITGLDVKQQKDIRNLLSYSLDPKQQYYTGSFNGSKRYLIDNKGQFPTGLLYLVENYLKANLIHPVTHNKRQKPARDRLLRDLKLKLEHIPYKEQIDAALSCQIHGRGIICAPTGVGKSIIAALIIDQLRTRTLIVVPTLTLKQQLTDSLKRWYGAKNVGEFGSKIAIENVDGLDPNVVADYDTLIIDEFHHSAARTYRVLNKKSWANIYYRFGLTATPFRTQDHERLLLESVLSKVIYSLSYQTAVDKGYIVPVEAYYIDIPRTKTGGRVWSSVYSDLVVNNEKRNLIIGDLIKRLGTTSVLCLVKEVQHGMLLQALNKKINFAHGSEPNTGSYILEFNRQSHPCLIGTTGVLGEGVDTKPAEVIIIAGLGKSKGQFMQQVGRGVRTYKGKERCVVIIFKDSSHKWTLAHYNAQVKILKEEYGVIPLKLDLNT